MQTHSDERIEQMQAHARERHARQQPRFIEWIDDCETYYDLLKKIPEGTSIQVLTAFNRASVFKSASKFNAYMKQFGYKISAFDYHRLFKKPDMSEKKRKGRAKPKPRELKDSSKMFENLLRSIKKASVLQIKKCNDAGVPVGTIHPNEPGKDVMLIMFRADEVPPDVVKKQIEHIVFNNRLPIMFPVVIVNMVDSFYGSGTVNKARFYFDMLGYKIEEYQLHKLKKYVDGWRDGWLGLE